MTKLNFKLNSVYRTRSGQLAFLEGFNEKTQVYFGQLIDDKLQNLAPATWDSQGNDRFLIKSLDLVERQRGDENFKCTNAGSAILKLDIG